MTSLSQALRHGMPFIATPHLILKPSFTQNNSVTLPRRKSQPSLKETRQFPSLPGICTSAPWYYSRRIKSPTSPISCSYLGIPLPLSQGHFVFTVVLFIIVFLRHRVPGLRCWPPASVESVPGVGAHCGTAPSPTRSCAILPPAARVLRLCRHVLQAPRSWFSWETLRCSMVIC